MKNILYVFPELNFGGAEKAAFLVSEELFQKYQYQINFFFLNGNEKNINVNPNFSVIFKNEVPLSPRNKYWERFIATPISIIKEIKKNKIDCVISGYEYDIELVLIITRLFFRNRNVKFISILQASLKGRTSEVSKKRKIIFLITDFLRCHVFDGIITVSESLNKELNSSCLKKTKVIANPLDKSITELCIRRNNDKLDDILKIQPYLLNVSRISIQKNLIFLLKAFNIIKKKTKHNLLIIGSISDQNVYTSLIDYISTNKLSDRVFIIPPVVNIYPIISNASIIAFTSLYEGFPLFILEAMYLRKVIVSTKFIGHKSLLNQQNCYLCNSFEVQDYGEILLKALQNDEFTQNLVSTAYVDSHKFNVQTISEQFHNYFKEII